MCLEMRLHVVTFCPLSISPKFLFAWIVWSLPKDTHMPTLLQPRFQKPRPLLYSQKPTGKTSIQTAQLQLAEVLPT